MIIVVAGRNHYRDDTADEDVAYLLFLRHWLAFFQNREAARGQSMSQPIHHVERLDEPRTERSVADHRLVAQLTTRPDR